MHVYHNFIRSKRICLFIIVLTCSGLFLFPQIAYAEREVLSEEIYYHLDMGVQLAYNKGSHWGNSFYGSVKKNLTATIKFANEIKVINAYPLESGEGGKYDFNGATSSHNIPKRLGHDGEDAYLSYYKDYVSHLIETKSYGGSGKTVTFSYDAELRTPAALEVVQYGKRGNDEEIYRLFDGKSALEKDQPKIAEAVAHALKAGREGTDGGNQLYLIFCPTVIEYKKFVSVKDLDAKLSLPTTAKQGETYTAADVSLIHERLTVDEGVLEKSRSGSGGIWEQVAIWKGSGKKGTNTGGKIDEVSQEEGTITYRLTITSTDGQRATDTKTIEIGEHIELGGKAELELPETTFEGHPVTAEDVSSFVVNGKDYTALRMYNERLASNSFSIVQAGKGTIKKLDWPNYAEAVFFSRGNYDVELSVKLKGQSTRLKDRKPITVLKTPSIEDALGGTQKQNRRQDVYANIALHPDYPVEELTIQVENVKTGEKVTHHYQKGEISSENGERLKSRPMEILADKTNQYFIFVDLPFLTKPVKPGDPTEEEYRYTIYVKDKKGDTDKVTKTFTVRPDLPPEPEISLDKVYLREKESNTAYITPEDMTISKDGDQISRSWGSGEGIAGYEDLSFGSGKKISFKKTGVGLLRVDLRVKDLWTEPTLLEYIFPEDYLEARTESWTTVDNVAPVVSVEPFFPVEGELLMFTDKQNLKMAQNAKTEFQQEFLRNQMDMQVEVRELADPVSNRNHVSQLNILHHKFGYQGGRHYQYLGQAFAIDNEKAYLVEANWPGTGVNSHPMAPYRLIAYWAETGEAAWSCNVDGSQAFTLEQDDTDTYLYLVYVQHTVIIDKRTGAVLTTIDHPLGKHNFVAEDYIYSIKKNGIYAVSRKNGSVRQVSKAAPLLADTELMAAHGVRRVYGKVHFVEQSGQGIFRTIFDLRDETMCREHLTEVPKVLSGFAPMNMGIDSKGKIGLFFNTLLRDQPNQIRVQVFDENNREIKRVEKEVHGDRRRAAYAIPNAKGEYEVFAVDVESQGSSYRYCDTTFYDLSTEKTATVEVKMGKNEQYFGDLLVYARDTGDFIQAGFGSDFSYLEGYGYTYFDKIRDYRLDKQKWQATGSVVSGYDLIDMGDRFGKASDRYAIIQAPDNSVDSRAGLRTKILGWNQNSAELGEQAVRKYVGNSEKSGLEHYVSIVDDTHSSKDEDLSGLILAVKRSGARLMVSGRAAEESGYLERLSQSVGGAIIKKEENLVSMMEKIINEKDSGKKVLKATPGEKGGTLSKTFDLEPGTTYYYEYEMKGQTTPQDILTAVFDLTRPNGEQGYLDDQYYVEQTQQENFGDPGALNPFFTYSAPERIQYGQYRAANGEEEYRSKYAETRRPSGQISFHVPPGKTALLSFDYDYRLPDGYERHCGAFIDGTLWDKETFSQREADLRGTYIHPSLLGAGEHQLDLRTIYYGTEPKPASANRFHLDRISVLILDRSPAKAQSQQASLKNKGNGWTTVSGSFITPEAIVDFNALPMSSIREDFEDESITYPFSWNKHSDSRDNFEIRNGKLSASSRSKTANFNLYVGYDHYNKLYVNQSTSGRCAITLGGATRDADHGSKNNTPNYKIEDGILLMNPFTSRETLEFKTVNNKAGLWVEDLLLLQMPNIGAVRNNQYFLAVPPNAKPGTQHSSRLWIPDHQFKGSSKIILSFEKEQEAEGTQSINLQALKIYRMKNGVKEYVADEYFTQSTATELFGWQAEGLGLSIEDQVGNEKKEENVLVYRKGEPVKYLVHYSDYEKDPSKKQYWRYVHEPFNDGAHPEAAVIVNADGTPVGGPGRDERLPMNGKPAAHLPAQANVWDASIDRFYIDGKYIVQHWQEDDTSRAGKPPGNPGFDKLSNVVEIPFYVMGGGEAPWITSIKTIPAKVKAGKPYQLQIGVDDQEKDVLDLRTEVYREGKSIYTHTKKGIQADVTGVYPLTVTGNAPMAEVGRYEVVCTVRDHSGAGIGTYVFPVISEGKVTGFVHHTPQWEENRKSYNVKRFGEEVNRTYTHQEYLAMKHPRQRGTNVFWSGEQFVLEAALEGTPTKVTAKIFSLDQQGRRKDTGYETGLADSGKENEKKERIWKGTLWKESMINRWGGKQPAELIFLFTADYGGGMTKTHEVSVIVDHQQDYWQLHRAW